jgi:hypothetical protein
MGFEQIGQQLAPQFAVAAHQLFFESDAPVLQADPQFGAALGKFGVEFSFQRADLFAQRSNLRRHRVTPWSQAMLRGA